MNEAAPNERVRAAARAAGLEIDVRTMPGSTHTAPEAAAALACDLGQIVKSLIFKGRESGKPHLLLVSGKNRVNENGVAGFIGESLGRADPAFVKDVTGYEVGGIPPLGLQSAMPAWFDRDLLNWEMVWAAAGTGDTLFGVAPRALLSATGATILQVS